MDSHFASVTKADTGHVRFSYPSCSTVPRDFSESGPAFFVANACRGYYLSFAAHSSSKPTISCFPKDTFFLTSYASYSVMIPRITKLFSFPFSFVRWLVSSCFLQHGEYLSILIAQLVLRIASLCCLVPKRSHFAT